MTMWIKHGVPGKTYGIYMADPELGAVHRPNSYNSNSLINNMGLRNSQDVPESKPIGATRIYCSGGSTTFCYNLDTDNAWPSVLQTMLRAEPGHERDEVYNGGEICFSLNHEFALARRLVPRLKPDIVLIYTGINEGMQAEQYAAQSPTKLDELMRARAWGVPSKNLSQAGFWIRHSTLARVLQYYIKIPLERHFQDPNYVDPADSHPFVLANLEHTLPAYFQFIRENKATPVLVRFGDNGVVDGDDPFLKVREKAVGIATDQKVIVCDAASVFQKRPDRRACFIESGVHVTRLGAKVLAEEVKATILRIPPRPDTPSTSHPR